MATLSVILPAYNEEKIIKKTYNTITQLLSSASINYELVWVDDGSSDSTWTLISEICQETKKCIAVRFSRNFGKEAAIFAGLSQATGDVVAVMDCDLQHPPQTLLKMFHLWEQGYEVIEGIKTNRGTEHFLHKKFANFFYKLMSLATNIDMQNTSDFKMMDRKVVDTLLKLPERNTFFRALSSWVGYKSISVEFEVADRECGTSKWTTTSLIKYAINNISLFTAAPLYLVTFGGFVMLLISIILGAQTLLKYLSGTAVEGFSTVILLILFTSSLIMISLGIIGYYLSKIYDEIKKRPKYIVSDIIKS